MSANKDFLLELYSEEIPASMQEAAAHQLAKRVGDFLTARGIEDVQLHSYSAPQRLAVLAYGLPARVPDRTEEKKGPRTDAPQQAIDGFLRANNLTSTEGLATRNDGKGAFYVLEITQTGQNMIDALAHFIPQMIGDFDWQKSMRWGAGRLRWVRPLHNILCCFGGKIVPFAVETIQSCDSTFGHRFLHLKQVKITRPDDYLPKLQKAKVLADANARKDAIQQAAKALAQDEGFTIVRDDTLMDEIAGLVEYPVPLLGRIDKKFMTLPQEVLMSVMRTHQKYIPLRKADGTLAPAFIAVANIATADKGAAIIAGNERVLRARFADAEFFWVQDGKTTLGDQREALKQVIFHAKIGSVYDKTERMGQLATTLANGYVIELGVDKDAVGRAAELCKSDLVSQMVQEFPTLQGTMGGYYAANEGLGAKVASAIRDHYKPIGAHDTIPETPEGCVVALADKLDTLIQFWRIDEKPTGSRDPYALRRAALGVVAIILQRQWTLPLWKVLAGREWNAEEDLRGFIVDRLQVYLRQTRNISHDIVAAVVATEAGQEKGDLFHVSQAAEALNIFLDTDDGRNLLAAYRRAYGICKSENKLPDTIPFPKPKMNMRILLIAEEKALAEALQKATGHFHEGIDKNLSNLATLRAPVDAFFEKVLVNVGEPELRDNRFALLQMFIWTMHHIADFSLIERAD